MVFLNFLQEGATEILRHMLLRHFHTPRQHIRSLKSKFCTYRSVFFFPSGLTYRILLLLGSLLILVNYFSRFFAPTGCNTVLRNFYVTYPASCFCFFVLFRTPYTVYLYCFLRFICPILFLVYSLVFVFSTKIYTFNNPSCVCVCVFV